MKINTLTLNPSTTISIRGDEDWLKPIYQSFEEWAGKIETPILGDLIVEKDSYGFVKVTGSLSFTPQLPCSRCADPIPFAINAAVAAEFRPYNDELPQDQDLQKEELDYYYVSKSGHVDIDSLVNDLVQTSIPSQIILPTDDGKGCQMCPRKFDDTKVFGSSPSADESPFAILKNIKLDS